MQRTTPRSSKLDTDGSDSESELSSVPEGFDEEYELEDQLEWEPEEEDENMDASYEPGSDDDSMDTSYDLDEEDENIDISYDPDAEIYDDPAKALPELHDGFVEDEDEEDDDYDDDDDDDDEKEKEDEEDEDEDEEEEEAPAPAPAPTTSKKGKGRGHGGRRLAVPAEAVSAKELAAQLRKRMRYKNLLGVSEAEKRERIERFELRIALLLGSLASTAKAIPRKNFDDDPLLQAMSYGWWNFLGNLSKEPVLKILLGGVPEDNKVILGGETFDLKELKRLPSDWEDCNLWGVYFDILSSTSEVYKGYIGSGTANGKERARQGLRSRLSQYDSYKRSGRYSESSAHTRFMVREDVTMNLGLLAFYDQTRVPRPYVLLMEKLCSVLLQVFRKDIPQGSPYLTVAAQKMTQVAVEAASLPTVIWDGLNGASQVLQGLFPTKRADRKCVQCKRPYSGMARWYNCVPGVFFTDVICQSCWRWTHDYGKIRTEADEAVRLKKVADGVSRPPKPSTCPGCGKIPKDFPAISHGRRTYFGKWFWVDKRRRWECQNCRKKENPNPGDALFGNDTRKDIRGGGYPDKGTPCPRCKNTLKYGRTNKNGRQSVYTLTYAFSELRNRWECYQCAPKPDDTLFGSEARKETRGGGYPAKGTQCPRCKKTNKYRGINKNAAYTLTYEFSELRNRWECYQCARQEGDECKKRRKRR